LNFTELNYLEQKQTIMEEGRIKVSIAKRENGGETAYYQEKLRKVKVTIENIKKILIRRGGQEKHRN